MASRNGYIEVEGLNQLHRAMAKAEKSVVEATMKGLTITGMEIIADAKMNLRANGSVVTGLLRAAGRVIRKGLELTIGFFDTTNRNSGYAMFVEYGRRAGKMPPPDELAAYAYKKFHLKDWKVAKSLGWAMAKRIAEQGTQPHPFFTPAVNKYQNRIDKYVKQEVNKKI